MTSFCLKYKPKCFDDFCMEPNLKCMLNTLVSMNNLNVLFVGNVGVGKTTYIDALIHEYYRDYSPQQYHTNIMHVNSLKEQGIHFYRNDVKTFCQTCSAIMHKKKIIVLDDFELIHEQNQQIFRNYIDKYSHNVHFMASCSNPQKVLSTLQSRFTIVKLYPPTFDQLHSIGTQVLEQEHMRECIEPTAFDTLIRMSSNAKQLLKYLEKIHLFVSPLSSSSPVSPLPLNVHVIHQICTTITFDVFEQYTSLLLSGQMLDAMTLILSVFDNQGYSVIDILDNYFVFVKHTTMLTDMQKYNCIEIICKHITVFFEVHEDEIELAFLTNNLCNVLRV